MASPAQFAKNMKKRARLIAKNVPKAIRAVGLSVDQTVVRSTPVDTGRARSNWIVSLDSPATIKREPFSPGNKLDFGEGGNANAAIQQAAAIIAAFKPGQVIWISNSLPYIGELNTGTSAQAPENFVEIAIRDGIRVLRKTKLLE